MLKFQYTRILILKENLERRNDKKNVKRREECNTYLTHIRNGENPLKR